MLRWVIPEAQVALPPHILHDFLLGGFLVCIALEVPVRDASKICWPEQSTRIE